MVSRHRCHCTIAPGVWRLAGKLLLSFAIVATPPRGCIIRPPSRLRFARLRPLSAD